MWSWEAGFLITIADVSLCILAVLCLVSQSCLTLCNPMDCSPTGSSVLRDSLGKNTGMGCHALLQGIFPTQRSNPCLLHWQADSLPLSHLGSSQFVCLVAESCTTLCNPVDCGPPGSSIHGDFPGKNTGVGFHALLREDFPTQEPNPGLPHCRQILYRLSHRGSLLVCYFVLEAGADQCPWRQVAT